MLSQAAEGRPPPVDGWEGDAGKRLRGRVAADFLEGVAWTLRYYYEGPVGHHGWAWFYRWPCAPLAVDLARAMPRPLPRRVGAALPCVTPLEQLGMVLPQPSMHALPSPLRQLPEMLPLAFPDADACRLGVDYDGKRFRWQGTLALPFVEAEQLRTPQMRNLSPALPSSAQLSPALPSSPHSSRPRCGWQMVVLRLAVERTRTYSCIQKHSQPVCSRSESTPLDAAVPAPTLCVCMAQATHPLRGLPAGAAAARDCSRRGDARDAVRAPRARRRPVGRVAPPPWARRARRR